MPKNTILVEVLGRDLNGTSVQPLYTCLSLSYTYRRDGAGSFEAVFPAGDKRLDAILLKDHYLRFIVGSRHAFTGVVERKRRYRSRTRTTVTITGPCVLGVLGENTVGELELAVADAGVTDGPAQILLATNVGVQNFVLDTVVGHGTTTLPVYRKFSGESALSALVKIAEQTGEHFRVAVDGSLTVVWLRDDMPAAPVRLVDDGGPMMHRSRNVAVIEEIEADENAERLINRIYPYGAGSGDAQLTLANATLTMPAGYTMNTAGNYIEWDAGQIYPSVRRGLTHEFRSIGVIEPAVADGEYVIRMDADAPAGSTTLVVDALPVPVPAGAALVVNGLVDIVTLTADAAEGATSLSCIATSTPIFDFDVLVYTVPYDPVPHESAANALAAATLAHLRRVSDPSRMVSYRIRARNVPETVLVGMTIAVNSQAHGFDIDDALVILQITRALTTAGTAPVTLTVVAQDWFESDEALEIAQAMEEARVARFTTQPVAAAAITGSVGTGSVSSINGLTGVVLLDSDDITQGVTNQYITGAQATKLAGIAAGAEVNVNADWSSVAGDSQILNKPTIPAETGAAIHAAATKATPDAADEWGLWNSVTGVLARINTTQFLTWLTGLYLLLAGKAGGQTVYGGTAADEDLTLEGTAHATKTTSYVLMQTTGGYVGIGTTSPEKHLQVNGSIYFAPTPYNTGGFFVKDSTGTARFVLAVSSSPIDSVVIQSIGAGLNFRSVAGASKMFIEDGGNVGIGTAAPAGKLHIDQASSTAAIPVITLDQADVSEELIEIISTAGAGNAVDTAALGAYAGKLRITVNGAYRYIPFYL